METPLAIKHVVGIVTVLLLVSLAGMRAASPDSVPATTPAVFWASSPVKPGEAVMVQGWGWGKTPRITVEWLRDGATKSPTDETPARVVKAAAVNPLFCNDEGLTFALPADWKPGLYRFRVTNENGQSEPFVLNAPQVWWCQGDAGQQASPGVWLRIFGVCLSSEEGAAVVLRSEKEELTLKLEKQDLWALTVAVPKEIRTGDYWLYVHTGRGGAVGWTEAASVRIAPHPAIWKDKTFDVTAYGAIANDMLDDTRAVQRALDAAGADGGGIVFVPRGRFQINASLSIPCGVLLKGAGTDLSLLYWRDSEDPLPRLIGGSNSFGIEDLTILACNHAAGVIADLNGTPGAGHVFLRRVVMRLNRFEAQNNDVIEARLLPIKDGPFAVQAGGTNIQITDCKVFSSYGPLDVQGTDLLISRNHFFAGDSVYFLGGERVVFEDNTLDGGPMARGGGVYCRGLYYARNRMGMTPRHDGEVFTSDGGGHAELRAKSVNGTHVAFDEEQAKQQKSGHLNRWLANDWPGTQFLYIVQGKGAGQYRRIVSHEKLTCEMDRRRTVEPDPNSVIFLCMHCFDRNMLVENTFHDATIVQSYAAGTEWILASNKFERVGGIQIFTHQSDPAWRMQCLGNEILAGNNYRGPESAAFDQDAHLGMLSEGGRCTVFRGNRLNDNARIAVLRGKNALVEGNTIRETDVGVVDRAEGTVLTHNHFEHVGLPIRESGTAVVHPAERLLIGLAAMKGSLPDQCSSALARLEKLATEPMGTPGLDERTRDCAIGLIKAAAADSRNGTYPMTLFESLFAAGIRVQCGKYRLLSDGLGGKLGLWLDVFPHVYSPAFNLSVSFSEVTNCHLTGLSGAVSPGKAFGKGFEAVLEPGVSTSFQAPMKWTATGEGWSLSGQGSLWIGPENGVPVTQWLLCGPFPNEEKGKVDEAVRGPERRLDLAGHYATMNGPAGWLRVCTNRLVFTNWFGPVRSASAFALTVNGEPKLLPRSRQVSGTLEAGDNFFLLRAANDGDNWEAAMSLSVAASAEPGDVQILSGEQLKNVAALNPPSRPAVPEGVSLPRSGGVDWRLVCEDDFDRKRIGNEWLFTGKEKLGMLTNGTMASEVKDIWHRSWYMTYARKVTPPLRVEFDLLCNPARGWGWFSALLTPADKVVRRADPKVTDAAGYMMKLNWPGDEQSRIWREETEVAKGNKTNRSMKRPGEWQHVTLQFVPPRMWIAVDGKEVMAFEEAHWLPDADTFSLLTTDQVCLDNIRIYTKRE